MVPELPDTIVYNIGMTVEDKAKLKDCMSRFQVTSGRIQFREFDFSDFDRKYSQYHIDELRLHSYAWKPIIISRILVEFGAFFWMDSSVNFQKSSPEEITSLFKSSKKTCYQFYKGNGSP